jgi:heat shock protein HslJ
MMTSKSSRRPRGAIIDPVTRLVVLPAALLAAGTVLSLAGCGDEADLTAAGEENPLATTTWTLVSYLDDAGDQRAAIESAPSTLAFGDDGFVTGNTGCNSFRGSYELDGDRLSVASTVTTRAACVPPEASRQERAVLTGLAATIRYVVGEGELALLDGRGGRLLVYAPASTDLAGTRWSAVGINNGAAAVVSSAATEAVEVEFRGDGSLGGTTGCRDLAGSYRLEEGDSSRLEIRPDTTGTGTCSPEQTEVEADLLAALTAATTYRISGNKLTLRNDSGSTQVTLLRR